MKFRSMAELMKFTALVVIVASILFSCCANDDCAGTELYLALSFEDSNGINLISEGLLSKDSISIVNIYTGSQEEINIDYVDNVGIANAYILYVTDSIKVMVGEKLVGIYDIELSDYDDQGCCDGFKNFNVYGDSNKACIQCNDVPMIIKL